jgi:hypothetical protein
VQGPHIVHVLLASQVTQEAPAHVPVPGQFVNAFVWQASSKVHVPEQPAVHHKVHPHSHPPALSSTIWSTFPPTACDAALGVKLRTVLFRRRSLRSRGFMVGSSLMRALILCGESRGGSGTTRRDPPPAGIQDGESPEEIHLFSTPWGDLPGGSFCGATATRLVHTSDMPRLPHPTESSPREAIFREQALQAWRSQDEETRVLLNLSPRWIQWAIVGVFVFAATGLLVAANTTIASRVMGPAVIRSSASGDSLIVEALLPARAIGHIARGQSLRFRSLDPRIPAITLDVLSVASIPVLDDAVRDRSLTGLDGRGETSPPILVRSGLIDRSRLGRDASLLRPGVSGTAQVVMGRETLLHMLRPRTSRSKSGGP